MGFFRKLKNNFRGSKPGQDAADELAWHLEQRVHDYVRKGMALKDAQAEAHKRIGNLTSIAEETVESDLLLWFDTLKREVMLALRMLRRAPTVSESLLFRLDWE